MITIEIQDGFIRFGSYLNFPEKGSPARADVRLTYNEYELSINDCTSDITLHNYYNENGLFKISQLLEILENLKALIELNLLVKDGKRELFATQKAVEKYVKSNGLEEVSIKEYPFLAFITNKIYRSGDTLYLLLFYSHNDIKEYLDHPFEASIYRKTQWALIQIKQSDYERYVSRIGEYEPKFY